MIHNSINVLIRSFLICNSLAFPLMAMDSEQSMPSNLIPTTKQGYVAAQTRFDILQGILKVHPSLTITTRISSKDTLWALKEADESFIAKAISDRPNKDTVNLYISQIDTLAKERKWDESMSISDMVFIGSRWVTWLSTSSTQFDSSQEIGHFNQYDKVLLEFHKKLEKDRQAAFSNVHITWVATTPGFIMPHISPTGSTPIPVMIKTWGFSHEIEGKNSARFLDYWAVPTQFSCSFDYFRDQRAKSSWVHDGEHTSRSRLMVERKDTEVSLNKSAHLYQVLVTSLNEENWKLAQLAHFHVFHEHQQLVKNLNETVKAFRTPIVTFLAQKTITPGTDFESIEQYETYVSAAKSLKINLEGDSIIDQYRSVQQKLLIGLDLLEKHAHAYDGYTG